MAGNTGKMTKEEIARRGPRKVLVKVRVDGKEEFAIWAEGNFPVGYDYRVIGSSYSLNYLKGLMRFN